MLTGWTEGAHRGLARGGHAHTVVVGLQDTVGPGLQGVANIDHDDAGDVRARVPALHLQAFTKAGSCLKPLNPDGPLPMQRQCHVTRLQPSMQGSAAMSRAAQPCKQAEAIGIAPACKGHGTGRPNPRLTWTLLGAMQHCRKSQQGHTLKHSGT